MAASLWNTMCCYANQWSGAHLCFCGSPKGNAYSTEACCIAKYFWGEALKAKWLCHLAWIKARSRAIVSVGDVRTVPIAEASFWSVVWCDIWRRWRCYYVVLFPCYWRYMCLLFMALHVALHSYIKFTMLYTTYWWVHCFSTHYVPYISCLLRNL